MKMVNTEALPVPGMRERLRAAAYYFGALPFAWRARSRQTNAFLDHHYGQAGGIFFLLFIVTFTFAFVILLLSYSLVFQREFYEAARLEGHLLNFTRKFFLCWLVFWGYAAGLAVFGSVRIMPIVGYLAQRKVILDVTVGALAAFYLFCACVAPFAVHASTLARQDEAPGAVYMLYEDMDMFPRWIFALGFYRITLAATERWGKDAVLVLDLNENNVRRVMREGRFIFFASHGRAQGMLLDKRFLRPAEVKAMDANDKLEFVYLTSCDGGVQKRAWEEAFAPAEVVTFDRLTAIIEHAWWMWFRGPEQIRKLS